MRTGREVPCALAETGCSDECRSSGSGSVVEVSKARHRALVWLLVLLSGSGRGQVDGGDGAVHMRNDLGTWMH